MLVQLYNSIDVNLAPSLAAGFALGGEVERIHFSFLPETLEELALDLRLRDECVKSRPVRVQDVWNERRRVRTEPIARHTRSPACPGDSPGT